MIRMLTRLFRKVTKASLRRRSWRRTWRASAAIFRKSALARRSGCRPGMDLLEDRATPTPLLPYQCPAPVFVNPQPLPPSPPPQGVFQPPAVFQVFPPVL
jgi:hypothetical protein